MDLNTPDNNDMLFFHQQRNSTRQYKRVRKEPEELPQALRYFKYANLNPRIAAFLGKQDPKNILKRAKGAKDGKEASTQPGADGAALIGGDFGTDLSHEARSLLPEIGQVKLDGFGDEGFGLPGLPFNAENEDSQRFQFEETTFAAPNILRELADTLSRFTTSFKEYAQRTTLYDPTSGEPLAAEATKPSVLLPAGITDLLCQEWEDVVADTIYTQRVWQSSAYMAGYKYTTALPGAKQDNLHPPIVVNTPAPEKTNASGGLKSELKSMVELLDDARSKTQEKTRPKKEGEVPDSTKVESKKKIKPSLKDLAQASTLLKRPSIQKMSGSSKQQSKVRLSDESKTKINLSNKVSVAGLAKGGRSGKGASFGKKDWSLRSTMSITGGEGFGAEKPRHGGNTTLCFNLSSKKAFDEGWIVNSPADQGLEEDNVLEWATVKLQGAIKQKEHEVEVAKSSGNDRPLLIRYYGDSRRDTLLKLYRKGNENDTKSPAAVAGLLPGRKPSNIPKIPQLSKIDNSKRERFLVQVPDGSITVYYPKTGEVAISASATPGAPGQLYVHCYANDELRTCLAVFTPYGKSCCYHPNGVPAFILCKEGGTIKSDDGSLVKKWTWPLNNERLKDNVIFHLSKEIYVRVMSRCSVTLHFTANRESTKIAVGAMPNAQQPDGISGDKMGVLRAGYKLSSQAATEFASEKKEDKAKSKHRRTAFGLRKGSKKPADLDELKHSLDPPVRFEFESQADRELCKLLDRSKHIVDQWMEHYRAEVGISSPALKKMIDKPEVKTSIRNIQSARERKMEEESPTERGTKFQSFRSPSAPPKHMIPGPHSIQEDLKKTSPVNEKKSPDTHVRIEVTPVTIIEPPMKSSDSQINPSRPRPATHGARMLMRPQKSSMRASSVSSHKTGQKSWTPASECCPVVTRNNKLFTESKVPDRPFSCKCSKHRIPQVNDLEFDYFIRVVAPSSQVLVISIVNSLYPDCTPYEAMLDKMYLDKNKNRSKPCMQSRHDLYRILRYDLAVAKKGTSQTTPLLLGRHNVVPGMTLMYCGGRLVFADHIFNGYGNARNDFKKQIYRTRQEYLMGHLLPDDFRFTPGRGKSGARAAWGGEVGGTGVDGKGRPGMFFDQHPFNVRSGTKSKSAGIPALMSGRLEETKSASDVTSESTRHPTVKMPQSKSFDTARDFVQFSLSTRVYVVPTKRSRTSTQTLSPTQRPSTLNSTFPPPSATAHSVVTEDGSLRAGRIKSYARMQAVK